MSGKRLLIYILLLLPLRGIAQEIKLSTFVRQTMMKVNVASNRAKPKGISNRKLSIMAFVRTSDIEQLRKENCRIYAQWDDIVIASIPLNRLKTLVGMPQIQRIEANKSFFITNDTTATITHTRDVWNSNLQFSNHSISLTGKDVVVGIMDVGFDLTHPTFYSADGQTYRIKQFWDQIDQTKGGDPVIGKTDDNNDTIYVGRQYIGQEALLSLKHSYDGLTQTHGTHTTGTAAGSGWQGNNSSLLIPHSTLYSGMAPDADICLVCNMAGDNADLVPDSLQYLYTSATDMLGFKYSFDYADKVGKPCVISFSEGMYDDLNECGLYSEVLSKMLGPGHILCASAGNEGGNKGTYIHKATGETGKGAFLVKSGVNTAIYVMESQKPVTMRLSFYASTETSRDYDLSDLALYPDSIMVDTVSVGDDTLLIELMTYPSYYDKDKYATDFYLIDKKHVNVGYSIPVSMTLLVEDNDVEAYCAGGYFTDNSLDVSLADFERTHNILFPGSCKDVICVGNCGYRTSFYDYAGNLRVVSTTKDGVLAPHSSIGPAISGITKPDVVAPGMNIISGYNSFFREALPQYDLKYDVSHFTWNDRQYQWHAMSGTSMSAPVVTGIIALWLQICPTLTPNQIKDVIAHTATHYDEAIEYPNNYYGWGQIDAIAGVKYIQREYTGIEEVSDSRFQTLGSDSVYTIDGRRVKSVGGLHGVFIIGGRKIIK